MREAAADDDELRRAGYRPQFRRGLGAFTAFAAGFSYLSILTGVVQNFYLGHREAGPAAFWTWPAVFAGQVLVALCFADLAREHPLCGGVYAWARRVGSPFVGWLTGWVYLASLVVTLAAVALAWQVVLPPLWSGFQVVESNGANAALLGTGLIAISTVINVAGTRWLAAIMNVGVVVELLAAVVLIILLAAHAVNGPAVVLPAVTASTEGVGLLGGLLAATVMSAYVMYGFDTAGTLAEETVDPRRRAPRAILQALVAAAFLGGLLLLFAWMSAPDLADPRLAVEGLPYLMKQVLGEPLGKVFIAASVAAIFICTLAVHAMTARILFAMARDKAVPFAASLGTVHPVWKTPTTASLVVGIAGAALLLFNMNFEQVMIALVCVAVVWANLAYLLTTGPLLWNRLRGRGLPSMLGRWGVVVNLFAVGWSVLLIVNVGWPRERFYGDDWYERYGAALFTAALLGSGVVVHRLVRRGSA